MFYVLCYIVYFATDIFYRIYIFGADGSMLHFHFGSSPFDIFRIDGASFLILPNIVAERFFLLLALSSHLLAITLNMLNFSVRTCSYAYIRV